MPWMDAEKAEAGLVRRGWEGTGEATWSGGQVCAGGKPHAAGFASLSAVAWSGPNQQVLTCASKCDVLDKEPQQFSISYDKTPLISPEQTDARLLSTGFALITEQVAASSVASFCPSALGPTLVPPSPAPVSLGRSLSF